MASAPKNPKATAPRQAGPKPEGRRAAKPREGDPAPRTASKAPGAAPPARDKGAARDKGNESPPRRSLLRRPTLWILLALLVGAGIFAFDLVQAEPQPVAPDIVDGDWIVIDRFTPELHPDDRPLSDLALVRRHDNRQEEVLGRIVAWDGDTLTWNKNTLTVNGEPVALPAPLEPSPRIPDDAVDMGLGQFLAAVAPTPPSRGKKNAARKASRAPAASAGRPRALGLPTAEVVVPRHHLYVLVPSDRKSGAVRGYIVPQGDITGLARIVLTNTRTEQGWYQRFMSLPGQG